MVIASGIAAGVVLGSAAGVAMEHATRPDPGPTKREMNEWERAFDRRFGTDSSDDDARNEQLGRDIEDYVAANPIPGRGKVQRTGGYWSVDRPYPEDRENANLFNALGAMALGVAGVVLIARSKPASPDMAWLVGPKGVALTAVPAAAAAYMGAMIVSANLLPKDLW